ncbi:MAG: flagellar protein FlaG, partial [Woeseiaceae bacterium]
LRPQLPSASAGAVQSGKSEPETGNKVPVAEQPQPDMEELAHKLNVASQSIGRDLRFEVDMESGHSVIQVLDRETGEVIRQIPPEKAKISIAGNGAVQIRLVNDRV